MTLAKIAAFPLWETLDSSISRDDQNVNFLHLVKVDGHKVRLRIRSNSYASQCWAIAEVWSATDMRWNEIATIPHGAMQTPPKLCYHNNLPKDSPHKVWNDPSHFRADSERLLSLVTAIIL